MNQVARGAGAKRYADAKAALAGVVADGQRWQLAASGCAAFRKP